LLKCLLIINGIIFVIISFIYSMKWY
jgi:hypothetical protein